MLRLSCQAARVAALAPALLWGLFAGADTSWAQGRAVTTGVTTAPPLARPGAPVDRIRAGDTDDQPLGAGSAVPGVSGFRGRGLALGASFETRYDDNLSRFAVKDDGFRLRPEARGSYGLGSERLGLFVNGSVGRDIVIGNDFQRGRNRYAIDGGVDFAVSRCDGEVGGSFNESLLFLGDVAQFGQLPQRNTTAGVAAGCRIGRALSITGSVARQTSTITTHPAFDFRSWDYRLGLGFGNERLGRFGINAFRSDTTQPGRLVITPDGVRPEGFQQSTVGFSYSRTLGQRGSVQLGVTYIDSQPSIAASLLLIDGVPVFVERQGFSGIGFNGLLLLQVTPRLSLDLAADRSAVPVPQIGALFNVREGFQVAARYNLGARKQLAGGFEWRRNDFRGSFANDAEALPRSDDRFQRIFASFSGQLGQRVRYTFDVAHSRRRSNPALFNFDSTSAGLVLSVDFGRR
jgi:hypothetical protein